MGMRCSSQRRSRNPIPFMTHKAADVGTEGLGRLLLPLRGCQSVAGGRRGGTWGVLENMTSTGKVRPGILNTGTPPKKFANLVLSSVALVTTKWKSRRRATTCAAHH